MNEVYAVKCRSSEMCEMCEIGEEYYGMTKQEKDCNIEMGRIG